MGSEASVFLYRFVELLIKFKKKNRFKRPSPQLEKLPFCGPPVHVTMDPLEDCDDVFLADILLEECKVSEDR